MIKRQVVLNYTLNPGWLSPFVDGLLEGNAIAFKCSACQNVSFPPTRTCKCLGTAGEWIPLSGKAKVLFRTDGSDGQFALAQFVGADTQTVVRIDGQIDAGSWELVKSENKIPAIAIKPTSEKTSL